MNEIRQLIVDAQKKQIANPKRACCNSEAAFVQQTLRQAGHVELSDRYWSWFCCFNNRQEDRLEFGDEVYELQVQLNLIDKNFSMPAWGTSGT